MGGNQYSWRDYMQPTVLGTGSTYYSSGWLGNKPSIVGLAGSIVTVVPTMGHIQTVVGLPSGGVQSGNFWFSIDTRDNVIIYQAAVCASGSTEKWFPDIWYPAGSKFVCHADKNAPCDYLFDGVITDI